MNRRRIGALVLVCAALGPAPSAPDAARHALDRYLRALERAQYARAYAMLSSPARAYYKDRANFASVFVAPGVRIVAHRISRAFAVPGPSGAVQFSVSERVRAGPAHTAVVAVSYRVAREADIDRVDDRAHPVRVVAFSASGQRDGAAVTVHRIDFFPRELAIALTFANHAPGFATFLPYNKTTLTDDRGNVYRSIESRDPRQMDRSLFLGVRLAQNAQLSGTMHFDAPAEANPVSLYLEIAPVVRERTSAPPFRIALPALRIRP